MSEAEQSSAVGTLRREGDSVVRPAIPGDDHHMDDLAAGAGSRRHHPGGQPRLPASHGGRRGATEVVFRAVEAIIILACVTLLPLLGVCLKGADPGDYLYFPPRTGNVPHLGFSWPAFALVACLSAVVIGPFLLRFLNYRYRPAEGNEDRVRPDTTRGRLPETARNGCFSAWATVDPCTSRRFPTWGWAALGLGMMFWGLAWTRPGWFSPWQRHTFTPLWLAYIVGVNAITFKRSGDCLITHRPAYFALLFPLSAAFWWGFEFLNRFVENWDYHGHGATRTQEYLVYGSIAFATVLPAVLSTRDLLATFPRLRAPFRDFFALPEANSPVLAVAGIGLAAVGLVGVGLIPNLSYPLLWLAPLMLLLSLRTVRGGQTVVSAVARGDWREVVLLASAALVCGFFWEMWNLHSLAKWTYSVPLVQRFHVFEMPLLGYLGYLPFGLECGAAAELVCGRHSSCQARVACPPAGAGPCAAPAEARAGQAHRSASKTTMNRTGYTA